jgi:uncharacterized membrane protein YebE (DUF533 family)
MFNPEKLLSGMLRSGMRGRGMGSLVSGGAALGLLGVAMEAFEHYTNKAQTAPQPEYSGAPPPPPAQGVPVRPGSGGPPPVPPGGRVVPPPPPGMKPAAGQALSEARAVLLIRAMIAAANADGVIDAEERQQIMAKLKQVDLSREEHQFIVQELLEPKPMESIVAEIRSPDEARQVYAASLAAITVDTEAEKQYLSNLAAALGLDEPTVSDIHRQLGA